MKPFTKKEINTLLEAIDLLIDSEQDTISHVKLTEKVIEHSKPNKYEKGFNILIDYFDSISDEEREEVNNRLKKLGL